MESHEERIQEIIERVRTHGVFGIIVIIVRWPWTDCYYLVTEQRTRSQ